LNILGDRNTDNAITADDVGLVSDSDHVQFNVLLHGESVVLNQPLAHDFGFPYLGLTVNSGSFKVTVGFDMQFGFGVSKTGGFYFDTSSNQELALTAKVTVPDLSATGHLGFLNASFADNPASPSVLTAAFGVDVQDPLS